jgi:DNA integrity scanning protein DisA with diadenylate cyclase activity
MHAATYTAFFDELSSFPTMEKDAGRLRDAFLKGTKIVGDIRHKAREAKQKVTTQANTASIKAFVKADDAIKKVTKGKVGALEVMEVAPAIAPQSMIPSGGVLDPKAVYKH